MSLENKLSAQEIVYAAGMSKRPEFYSGRGATTSDLTDEILEKIYKTINEQYGKKVAKAYVNMVAAIPKLSATDFLLTLYNLENNNWKWNKNLLSNQKGIHIDGPSDEAKYAVGLASIVSFFESSSDRDQTNEIRNSFLKRHGMQKKESYTYGNIFAV